MYVNSNGKNPYKVCFYALSAVIYFLQGPDSTYAQTPPSYNCTNNGYALNCNPVVPLWVPPNKPTASGRKNRCSADALSEMGRALNSPMSYPGQINERIQEIDSWKRQCESVENEARHENQQKEAIIRDGDLQSFISSQVRMGKCAEARDAALDAGRMDLADQVVNVCRSMANKPSAELSPTINSNSTVRARNGIEVDCKLLLAEASTKKYYDECMK